MTKHLCIALIAVVGLAASTLAHGQRPKQGQTPREKLTAAGTVKGYSGGLLHVMTKEGDQYRVKLPTNPMYVTYVGSATRDFLKRGMLVKFTATFDAKGKVVAPVRDITIFTPTKEDKIGVYPDSGLSGSTKDLFSDVDTNQKQPEGKPFSVAGTITSARSGKIKVAAGRMTVQADLAEKARVSVQVSHLSFVQPGDNISLDGWYNPAQKRDVVANKITVSAAGTLGEPAKKPTE